MKAIGRSINRSYCLVEKRESLGSKSEERRRREKKEEELEEELEEDKCGGNLCFKFQI